jgi:hypothetical protein
MSKAAPSKSLEFEGFRSWAAVKINYGEFATIKTQSVCLRRGLLEDKQD